MKIFYCIILFFYYFFFFASLPSCVTCFLFFLALLAYFAMRTKRECEDLEWKVGNTIQERDHARAERDSARAERDRACNRLRVLDWVHNLGP